jgi:hypothetical protein
MNDEECWVTLGIASLQVPAVSENRRRSRSVAASRNEGRVLSALRTKASFTMTGETQDSVDQPTGRRDRCDRSRRLGMSQ